MPRVFITGGKFTVVCESRWGIRFRTNTVGLLGVRVRTSTHYWGSIGKIRMSTWTQAGTNFPLAFCYQWWVKQSRVSQPDMRNDCSLCYKGLCQASCVLTASQTSAHWVSLSNSPPELWQPKLSPDSNECALETKLLSSEIHRALIQRKVREGYIVSHKQVAEMQRWWDWQEAVWMCCLFPHASFMSSLES